MAFMRALARAGEKYASRAVRKEAAAAALKSAEEVAAKAAEERAAKIAVGRAAASAERIPQRAIQTELEAIGPRGSSARQRYIDLMATEQQGMVPTMRPGSRPSVSAEATKVDFPNLNAYGEPTMSPTFPQTARELEMGAQPRSISGAVERQQVERRIQASAARTGIPAPAPGTAQRAGAEREALRQVHGAPSSISSTTQPITPPGTPVQRALRRGMVVRGAAAVGGAGAAASMWDEDKRGPAPRSDRPFKNSY